MRFQRTILAFAFIFGGQGAYAALPATQLRPGDVLLQPLNCWACTLIEEEEETRFSHIGVVIATAPAVIVAEAYGKVQAVPLSVFDAKTERRQAILVLRFRNPELQMRLVDESPRLQALYRSDFDGAEYDSAFRWNNFDGSGREKLYCSELVTKLFQAFAGVEIGVKRMHFTKNREAWERFFKGQVPDGLPGNSPEDFRRSKWFYEVGELVP